jgi:hypothetical protein
VPRPSAGPAPTVAIFRDFWQSRDRRTRLNQRLRQAFIEGAEEDSRRRLGRGLTAEELERVLRHYPGDVGVRRKLYGLSVAGPRQGLCIPGDEAGRNARPRQTVRLVTTVWSDPRRTRSYRPD